MKTPEQMALEYADNWHKDCDYPAEILRHTKKATETVFLAGYKAAQQWISVKERLPEEGLENQIVLVWRASWHDYDTVRWKSYEFDDVNSETITHWMPLPEAPEDK
jgi:hypothetical protein